MPSRYQIHCVSRSDLLNHHRRLRAIGGVNPDGSRWRLSEQDAIAAIEAGRWSFFVEYGGRQHKIIVTVSRYGSKYIKAEIDGLHPERLLALPECG